MAAHDAHYQGTVQPIRLMEAQMSPAAFQGFLRGNIIKYAARMGKKDDPRKESAKLLQYAIWLHQSVGGEEVKIT